MRHNVTFAAPTINSSPQRAPASLVGCLCGAVPRGRRCPERGFIPLRGVPAVEFQLRMPEPRTQIGRGCSVSMGVRSLAAVPAVASAARRARPLGHERLRRLLQEALQSCHGALSGAVLHSFHSSSIYGSPRLLNRLAVSLSLALLARLVASTTITAIHFDKNISLLGESMRS